MRVIAYLTAQADCAYDNTYHHKLRGRTLKGIKESPYSDRHDAQRPIGFNFSNPFPIGKIEEGDERMVIVSAPEEDLIAHISADFLENKEFNIGNLPFRLDDLKPVYPDVGEPGSSGIITTATGVSLRFHDDECKKYGLEEYDGNGQLHWRPKHGTEAFVDAIEKNLDWKHNLYCEEHLPGPKEFDYPLFDEMELIKTYGIPITVTTGVEQTYVLSKWNLKYNVRDNSHRRHLNLALDCGIGERNGHGLGFLNIIEGGTS